MLLKQSLRSALRLWGSSVAGAALTVLSASAQSLAPEFIGSYSIRNLSSIPELPAAYGALTFQAGDTNILLVGGDANTAQAGIYAINVQRGSDGHISGFTGQADFIAQASGIIPGPDIEPVGGIDGGLAYGPGGVLFYTTYSDNGVGQLKPGSAAPEKRVDLTSLGYEGSTGSLAFVPAGFAGAGRLKITSYKNSIWYDTTTAPDEMGTYDILAPARSLSLDLGGPEGIFYVKGGSPRFPKDSVLIGYYGANIIRAYEIDGNGDPVLSTGRDFITALDGITGATMDPATGDFVFSSFSNPFIYVVGGFRVATTLVNITNPVDNATFLAPASFWVEADARQEGGSIDHVDFFNGAVCLGTTRKAPYHAFVEALPPGIYALTAIAYDGNGVASTSSVVHVRVIKESLQANLVWPTGTNTLPACSGVRLTADTKGGAPPIQSVVFYDGTTEVGRSTSPPFVMDLPHLLEGTHIFSVSMTDSAGMVATSGTSTLDIQPLPENKLVAHSFLTNALVFCFKGSPGSNYVLETSSALGQPWTPIQTNQAPEGALVVTNPMPAVWLRFYRERRVP